MTRSKQDHFFGQVRAYWIVVIIMIFMAVGTSTELFLLDHYEDQWQLAPIVLIGLSTAVFILSLWKNSKEIIRLFKALMLGCAISGVVGFWFHLKANIEFERELHPSSSGWVLISETLSGALPTLAPGSMIVFASIGYLYTLLKLKQPK
ncbi:MAG: hypothetical protein AAGF85_18650 [Bacteroidota bacterium]